MNKEKKIPFVRRTSYPVYYMFTVTFVTAGILIGFDRMTSGRVEANRRILFEKAVLEAVGMDVGEMSSREIHGNFTEHVKEPSDRSAGAWGMKRQGSTLVYALPFDGKGFWDTIRGVVGIEADGSSLTGLAFFKQRETPGLGAEIVKPRFTDQFKGLSVGDGKTAVRLVSAGAKSGRNEVDAVTGATETCSRLEDILNNALFRWRNEMGLSGETVEAE